MQLRAMVLAAIIAVVPFVAQALEITEVPGKPQSATAGSFEAMLDQGRLRLIPSNTTVDVMLHGRSERLAVKDYTTTPSAVWEEHISPVGRRGTFKSVTFEKFFYDLRIPSAGDMLTKRVLVRVQLDPAYGGNSVIQEQILKGGPVTLSGRIGYALMKDVRDMVTGIDKVRSVVIRIVPTEINGLPVRRISSADELPGFLPPH